MLYELSDRWVDIHVMFPCEPFVNILEDRLHDQIMALRFKFSQDFQVHKIYLVKIKLFWLDTYCREGVVKVLETEGKNFFVV